MNNEGISYPTKEDIERWIVILKDDNVELRLKLPVSDEDWYRKVIDTIQRINVPYISGLHCKAARLFYYLDKDHNFLDGNKRTAILITYLFYLINGHWITSPERTERLAKKLAASIGSRKREEWMKKIEKELTYITTVISE
jgi:death-on-curing family protein